MPKINVRGNGLYRLVLACLICLSIITGPVFGQDGENLSYPKSQKMSHTDEYFGVQVSDPFQWPENDVRESDDVKAWVESQNKVTFGYINSLPFRDEIESRLTKLWDYEKFGTPFKRGGRYYYSKNDGLQNQNVVYQMDSLDSGPTVLIDPNKWSEDGTVALGGMAFSDDGKYLAYGVQESGSDRRTQSLKVSFDVDRSR